MYNILLSLFHFDEDWCREKIRPYLNHTDNVTVLPLTFHAHVDTSEKWQEKYHVGSVYYNEITKPFQSFGYDVSAFTWINPFVSSKEQICEILNQTDLLILPGGLPDLQIKRMEQLDIIDELRNYYGNVLGVSSGAMTQPPVYYLSPDADYPKSQYHLKGIGLIDLNAQVEVHFNQANKPQVEALKHVTKESNVIAIGDQGCLIVDHNHIEAIGDVLFFEKGGNVYDVISNG